PERRGACRGAGRVRLARRAGCPGERPARPAPRPPSRGTPTGRTPPDRLRRPTVRRYPGGDGRGSALRLRHADGRGTPRAAHGPALPPPARPTRGLRAHPGRARLPDDRAAGERPGRGRPARGRGRGFPGRARRLRGRGSPVRPPPRRGPPRRRVRRVRGVGETQAAMSARVRANTASSIGRVSFPVNVFCWLGW